MIILNKNKKKTGRKTWRKWRNK